MQCWSPSRRWVAMTKMRTVDLDRFWLPVGQSYSITPAGWLADVEPGDLRWVNTSVVKSQFLADRKCLVLLGEPGMGKTSALAGGRSLRPPVSPLTHLHFDLGIYGSEDRLARAVFESALVEEWQSGSAFLSLSLDSFDEAMARVGSLPRMLASFLDSCDSDRLFLRIACRTADWPNSLRSVLDDHFGNANLHELLPLRRRDAALLLQWFDKDAERILSAIEEARIVPLASRPLTLELLRSSLGPDGSLPASAGDLYKRGLEVLLDEMNPERRPALQPPGAVLGRMRAAEQIAAKSLFGSRPTIWTGPIAAAVSDDLTVDDCVGPRGRDESQLSSDVVDATLRSGLFSGAGEGRLTWSHATFADYLCAQWLVSAGLDDQQVQSLLLANDGRIYAQVRQVAAWLVALHPARFRVLIARDAQAFLAAVDIPEESLRREIVHNLLRDAEAGPTLDEFETDYSGLRHEGLAEQLRPALLRPQGDVSRLAVRIARHCAAVDSMPDLTQLALNQDADTRLRAAAVMTIQDIAGDAPTHELVPLIHPPAGQDLDQDAQELQAAALMASWPHAVTSEVVFPVLSPPSARNFFGIYHIFISHFAENLRTADSAAACEWVITNPELINDSRFTSLISSVVRLCIENIDDERVQNAISAVVFRRVENYDAPLLEGELPDTADVSQARRAVAKVLLTRAGSEDQVWRLINAYAGSGTGLLDSGDLAWLIDLLGVVDGTSPSPGNLRENIGHAVSDLYTPGLVQHSTIVLSLPEAHPASQLFKYWRLPVDLDSESAVSARALWTAREQKKKERSVRRGDSEDKADDWVNLKIGGFAAKAAEGEVDAFWRALRLLTVRPGTNHYMDEHQPDLTLLPRWHTLPPAVQAQLVRAAGYYLESGQCSPQMWLGTKNTYFPARAGYRALVLLLRLTPSALAEVSRKAWREWAPILIDWAATVNGANFEDKILLLERARPHAEDVLQEAILAVVDRAIEDGSPVFLQTELPALSSEPLARQLIDRLSRPMTTPTRDSLLEFLVGHHMNLISPTLQMWLQEAERHYVPERAADAVCRLLRLDATDSWGLLSSLMREDSAFVEAALLSHFSYNHREVPGLAPAELADLYLWLYDTFPPARDPVYEDAHVVGSRESLGQWRDAVLLKLSRTGTQEAVAEIERIVRCHPEAPWLERVLAEAARALRERSWEPLAPVDLDELGASRRARIVRTDADLYAVTMLALDEIEGRLQADTPSAYLLWDTFVGRPKAEDEISDYLAIELEQRLNAYGVVVNREVQVRRNKPSGLPERTDLRVEATQPTEGASGTTGTLRIPGEVKGSWNAELVGSLSTQLVQRYMRDFQTNYGIYVVAWFNPAYWNPPDGRLARAKAHGSKEDIISVLRVEADKQRTLGRTVAVRVLDFSLRR